MKLASFILSLLWLSLISNLHADSLASALQAQQMLGPGKWSQVLKVRNDLPSARYGETVYGTIFEFSGTLWFYTDSEGTQPLFSRRPIDRQKTALMPILRSVHRGFSSYTVVSAEASVPPAAFAKLKNGCVIESIYTFVGLTYRGAPLQRAKLLLYTARKPASSGRAAGARAGTGTAAGHCVLVYETPDGRFYVDPSDLEVTGSLKPDVGWDAASIAHAIESAYWDCIIGQALTVLCPIPEETAQIARR